MRLLNVYTYEFRDFPSDDSRPPYVITSHRWVGQEITYQKFLDRDNDPQIRSCAGYQKVESFCKFVRDWGHVITYNYDDAAIIEELFDTTLLGRTQSHENASLEAEAQECNADCEACAIAKATCNLDRPACERCLIKNLPCVYSDLDKSRTRSNVVTEQGPVTSRLEWIWIDTCCINKESSAELQEAINTMFRWYTEAFVCLTFMHDVLSLSGSPSEVLQDFRQSVWFTRGWTLQELLAPQLVVFVNKDWEIIGHKTPMPQTGDKERFKRNFSVNDIRLPLNHWLSDITGIREDILADYGRSQDLGIGEKRAWMSNRTTTRTEDGAYCLLGICGVYLPLIYGEREQAFDRLEEAITRRSLKSLSRSTTINGNHEKIDSTSKELEHGDTMSSTSAEDSESSIGAGSSIGSRDIGSTTPPVERGRRHEQQRPRPVVVSDPFRKSLRDASPANADAGSPPPVYVTTPERSSSESRAPTPRLPSKSSKKISKRRQHSRRKPIVTEVEPYSSHTRATRSNSVLDDGRSDQATVGVSEVAATSQPRHATRTNSYTYATTPRTPGRAPRTYTLPFEQPPPTSRPHVKEYIDDSHQRFPPTMYPYLPSSSQRYAQPPNPFASDMGVAKHWEDFMQMDPLTRGSFEAYHFWRQNPR